MRVELTVDLQPELPEGVDGRRQGLFVFPSGRRGFALEVRCEITDGGGITVTNDLLPRE